MRNNVLTLSVIGLLYIQSPRAETSGSCAPTNDSSSSCQWEFDENTQTLTISGNGAMADCSINTPCPWSKKGYTILIMDEGITGIGIAAFSWDKNISDIHLPNTLTSIGSSAFYGLVAVNSLTIPNSVTTIGDGAFGNMFRLRSLTIPDSIKTMGENAFAIYDYEISDYVVNNSIQSLDISAGMLSKYLNAKGGFAYNANINCMSGDCFSVLKTWDTQNNTNYASQITVTTENADGSRSVYKNGDIIAYKGKKIYTIDEANRVAGDKNRFSIRYR